MADCTSDSLPCSGSADTTSAPMVHANKDTCRPSSVVSSHKGKTVQKLVSRFWRGCLSQEELAAKLPQEIWAALEGAGSEEEMCRLAKTCTNRAKRALRPIQERQRAAVGKEESTKPKSATGSGRVDDGEHLNFRASSLGMSSSKQEESIGAIVVPSHLTEFFCMAVNGVEGWTFELWCVTEYEPGVSSRDLLCNGTLHAVHLSSRGAILLSAISAEMPQSDHYNLMDMLGCDRTLPQRVEQILSRLEVDDFHRTTPTKACKNNERLVADRKILDKLCAHCADMQSLGDASFAFWVPGLNPTSRACCRNWEAPLYEASHAHRNMQPPPRFTFIELFAGIGGFRLGLEPLGGRCVLACEADLNARSTYRHNFADIDGPLQPFVDVRCINTADLPAFDVLTAGFPCQPYTQSNTKRQGLNCENGQLVFDMVRILRECQPAAALLENVPDLLTSRNRADFQKIVTALQEAGYVVGWQLISAEHFVPQVRLRLYIVCIRRDLHDSNAFLRPAHVMNAQDGDYGGEGVIEWLDLRPGKRAEGSTLVVKEILEDESSNVTLDSYTLSEEQWAKVVEFEARKNNTCLEKRLVQLDGQARTLISHYKRDLYFSQFVPQPDSRPRFFTPRECARLMGFPDSFKPGVTCFPGFRWLPEVKESNFYRQLGNAVVPAVIQEIGARILDAIKL